VANLLTDERGQAFVEYGLVLGLVAMVVIGAFLMVGSNLNSKLSDPLTVRPAPIMSPDGR